MSSEHSMSDIDADLVGHGESGSDSDLELPVDNSKKPLRWGTGCLDGKISSG